MDKSHFLDFSKGFLKNHYTAFGRDATEAWLARLPYLLSETASRWGLELGTALPGLSYNYVCSVTLLPTTQMESPTAALRKEAGGEEAFLELKE
jgi:hypothetical protein